MSKRIGYYDLNNQLRSKIDVLNKVTEVSLGLEDDASGEVSTEELASFNIELGLEEVINNE